MPHCPTKDTWAKSWASEQLPPKPHRPGPREPLTRAAHRDTTMATPAVAGVAVWALYPGREAPMEKSEASSTSCIGRICI